MRNVTATLFSCGKMESLTHCKIETLEQIVPKFVKVD